MKDYVSNNVFEGVRVKTGKEAREQRKRAIRSLARQFKSDNIREEAKAWALEVLKDHKSILSTMSEEDLEWFRNYDGPIICGSHDDIKKRD